MTPRTYTRLTRFALWALTAIVVSGAAVRLTGSGLGCSDWPTCEEGKLVADVEYHALIEFVNRMFTGVVSVAVILAVVGSLRRRPRRFDLTWWSAGLVVGVIAQVVLGGLLVLTELDPRFTMGHFLLSMVLVWNAVVLHDRSQRPDEPQRSAVVSGRTLELTRLVGVVGVVLLVTGTIVTGSGPHAGDEDAERLPFLVRETTRVHSLVAIGLLVLVLVLWWRARTVSGVDELRRRAERVAGLLVVQGTVGYVQYFAGVPALLVGVHVLLATLTWIELVRLQLATNRYTEAPSPGPDRVGVAVGS